MNRIIPALMGAFGLAGIVIPAFGLPYQLSTPFKEEDFQQWVGSGPANLHGQAFLKTVGGDVKTCAGEPVILMPDNPYDEEMVAADIKGYTDVNITPRALTYFRRTICDAQGNFVFLNLPAVAWYLDTKVTWETSHIEQPGERPGPLTSLLLGIPPPPETDQQGGELRKIVTLAPGENQAFLIDADEVRHGSADQPSGAPLHAPQSGIADPNSDPKASIPTNATGGITSQRITSPSAPTLGVGLIPTPTDMSLLLKLDKTRGLWILTVDENSAAARAGLSRGDVILTGNGMPWDTLAEGAATLNGLHTGDQLTLIIWRMGSEKTIVLKF